MEGIDYSSTMLQPPSGGQSSLDEQIARSAFRRHCRAGTPPRPRPRPRARVHMHAARARTGNRARPPHTPRASRLRRLKRCEYLTENGYTVPVAIDPGTTSRSYGVSGIPAAALVDKDGNVVFRNHPAQVTDELIQKYL